MTYSLTIFTHFFTVESIQIWYLKWYRNFFFANPPHITMECSYISKTLTWSSRSNKETSRNGQTKALDAPQQRAYQRWEKTHFLQTIAVHPSLHGWRDPVRILVWNTSRHVHRQLNMHKPQQFISTGLFLTVNAVYEGLLSSRSEESNTYIRSWVHMND